ncbi:MAG: hypothetical protein KVP17_004828 [Porospora cf. gigantea B]|uniref:uncharacterized protein n=1 Tax=Porospora cf. gigantea B TaxID=2853592 RepID=UPI003571B480|nr:MAG: hypothetical protein KVP17_004828 [Porospora cf. gigantea B]
MSELVYDELLPEEYGLSLELDSLSALEVEPKLCSQVLKLLDDGLKDMYPHLRRVSSQDGRLRVLLKGPLSVETHSALSSLLGCDLTFLTVEVPRKQPVSREQFDSWKEVWPMGYKQPSWRPTPVTVETREIYDAALRLVEGMARDVPFMDDPCCASACCIIQGTTVISAETHRRDRAGGSLAAGGPLAHCGFRAIEGVASAVRELEAGDAHPLCRLRMKRDRKGYKNALRKKQKTVEAVSERFADLSPLPTRVGAHLTAPLDSDIGNLDGSQYYCKGLTAVFSSAPCLFCGMCLLHSRIATVVFLDSCSQEDLETSAFGKHWRLNARPDLNHNFVVYKVSKPRNPS